jgi:hypothetical protein
LALFYLLTIILMSSENYNNKATIFAIGFLSAASGWIKNEGLLFFLITILFYFLKVKNYNLKFFGYFLSGAFIPLTMILIFKLHYAPSNDIIAGQSKSFVEKILDLNRYAITLKFLLSNLVIKYYILVILTLVFFWTLIKNKIIKFKYELAILTSLLTGYFFIYIITPNDLIWHLATSLDRLIHQIYPSFLFLILVTLSSEIERKEKLKTARINST